jgi:hypothetical protein
MASAPGGDTELGLPDEVPDEVRAAVHAAVTGVGRARPAAW